MTTSMTVRGMPELRSRVEALKGAGPAFTRTFAPIGLRYIKIETPRKTGNLSRSNAIAQVIPAAVYFVNRANYAMPVHQGSRPHIITPKRAKALGPIAATASGRRLSGKPRKGAQVYFAKRVKHPGFKGNPFMLRGLQTALQHVGMRDPVVDLWNKAG